MMLEELTLSHSQEVCSTSLSVCSTEIQLWTTVPFSGPAEEKAERRLKLHLSLCFQDAEAHLWIHFYTVDTLRKSELLLVTACRQDFKNTDIIRTTIFSLRCNIFTLTIQLHVPSFLPFMHPTLMFLKCSLKMDKDKQRVSLAWVSLWKTQWPKNHSSDGTDWLAHWIQLILREL